MIAINLIAERWRAWRDGTYEVSTRGRIRRTTPTRTTKTGHILRPHRDKTTGYLIIGLRADGRRKTRYVHAVVAEVWIGTRPSDRVVNHKNGDKRDCSAANLEYITQAANIVDGQQRARRRDPGHGGRCLTLDDVRAIRLRAEQGELVKRIAADYGVHRTTISAVVLRHTWSHVS